MPRKVSERSHPASWRGRRSRMRQFVFLSLVILVATSMLALLRSKVDDSSTFNPSRAFGVLPSNVRLSYSASSGKVVRTETYSLPDSFFTVEFRVSRFAKTFGWSRRDLSFSAVDFWNAHSAGRISIRDSTPPAGWDGGGDPYVYQGRPITLELIKEASPSERAWFWVRRFLGLS